MVTYVSLEIFFVNKLSTHPGKYIMVVYHLEKRSRKILLKSKWKTNFWVLVPAEISRSNGTSEKVVLFFRTEHFKRKFVFHFFKPPLIPVSGLRGRFPINETDSYKW